MNNMIEEIKKLRSYYYEFFAFPFFFYENDEKFLHWQKQLDYLSSSPIQEENSINFQELKKFDFKSFKEEQNSILFDFSYANVPLTASFYLEGRDEGKAKELVISTIKKSPFRRDPSKCKDSEDFLGFIFLLMSSLLRHEENKSVFLSTELFVNIINPISGEFIYMLKNHKKAVFYKNLAEIFDSFMDLERAALGIEKPEEKEIARKSLSQKPYESKMKDVNSKYFIEDLDFSE